MVMWILIKVLQKLQKKREQKKIDHSLIKLLTKVIIQKSRGEVSLVEQDTIKYVS
jgi:hypothetical protein